MKVESSDKNFAFVACTHIGCDRKDLRGLAGLAMHIQRAHKRTWSTRPKSSRQDTPQ